MGTTPGTEEEKTDQLRKRHDLTGRTVQSDGSVERFSRTVQSDGSVGWFSRTVQSDSTDQTTLTTVGLVVCRRLLRFVNALVNHPWFWFH